MSAVARGLPTIVFVLACNGSGTHTPATTTTPSPPAQPQSAIPGVYALACETECADEAAQLVTYRDSKGAIAVVTVQGSPAACSHPPLRFMGSDGAERAVIPMQPVVPGSEDARHFDDIRAKQLAGLTKAETMSCRDVKH